MPQRIVPIVGPSVFLGGWQTPSASHASSFTSFLSKTSEDLIPSSTKPFQKPLCFSRDSQQLLSMFSTKTLSRAGSSIGSDPRDKNHPLSISQLTSSHKKPGDK